MQRPRKVPLLVCIPTSYSEDSASPQLGLNYQIHTLCWTLYYSSVPTFHTRCPASAYINVAPAFFPTLLVSLFATMCWYQLRCVKCSIVNPDSRRWKPSCHYPNLERSYCNRTEVVEVDVDIARSRNDAPPYVCPVCRPEQPSPAGPDLRNVSNSSRNENVEDLPLKLAPRLGLPPPPNWDIELQSEPPTSRFPWAEPRMMTNPYLTLYVSSLSLP
jgi:hypothetical protein